MAISVDPQTFVITVPKADTTLVQTSPTEIRQLDLNIFRLQLKDWEDNGIDGGITFTKTHTHNTEVSLGGITYARVIELLAPYTITFEDGQYAVNLVGANSNIGDRVNVNQVSVRSTNSAGLISNAAIEFSSFNGGVWIDVANISGLAVSGTSFPAGTRQAPVNNIESLKIIATFRGFDKVFVIGNLTLTTGDNFARYSFEGESPTKTIITVDSAANVTSCEFRQCTVSGTLDGNSEIINARISNIDFVDGKVQNSDLGPDIIKLGTSTNANIFSCFSTVPGSSTPVIDMNATGILGLRDYNGGIELRNYSGTGAHSIDMSSGQIKLDPNTITSGTFVCRGIGKLINASTGEPIKTGSWNGGVTVVNELINLTTISEAAVYTRAVYIDTINGRAGTSDPIGLERDPVDNFTDALIIANRRGTTKIIFKSDYTFAATDAVVGFELFGKGRQYITLTFTPGCIFAFCDFHDCTMTGSIAGVTGMTDCHIHNLGSVGLTPSSQDLIVKNCEFSGTITLPSNYSGDVTLLNCYSSLAVTSYPIFDAGNFTGSLLMDNWSGQVELKNLTLGNQVDIRISQGEVELETATVTNANIHVVGTGYLFDDFENEIVTGVWNGNVIVENETLTATAITEQDKVDLAGKVWDEALTGATHNIPTSAGRRLRQLASTVVWDGIAQGAGINGNQIILDVGAASFDGAYDPSIISIVAGAGLGQSRQILEYEGATRTATVDRDWKVLPNNTSEFMIVSSAGREHVNEGLAQGGTINSITLNALASPHNGAYIHQTVFIRSGHGADQAKMVMGYDGLTKVATIEGTWGTIPDTTSAYVMLPVGTAVWTEAEKDEALAYSKKASDNAEQANLKL